MFAINTRLIRCAQVAALTAVLVALGGTSANAGGGMPSVTINQSAHTAAPVKAEPAPLPQTFGEAMRPAFTEVLSPAVATVSFTSTKPEWFARNALIRWDNLKAFAHSLTPLPYGSLYSDAVGQDYANAAVGAEYHLNNSRYKSADVRFIVTGKRFAIRYWTVKSSDAMVWIDGKPVSPTAFAGSDPAGTGSWNWLVVTRAARTATSVRFAGPLTFTGVDYDRKDAVTVTADRRFTVGVISDSFFESMNTTNPMTQAAGPMLSTLTGFRVWNMAEGGTGYVNDGSGLAASGGTGYAGHKSSAFGSSRRMASIASAPIDALLVNGSVNDMFWSASAQREAMDTFLDQVAAVRPGLPVVLVGLEPLSYGGLVDQTDTRFQAINANFDDVASRHPNVVGVINPYKEDWLTGTGGTAIPKGDGNQDQYVGNDGVHLSAAGQAYYQGRIVEALRGMPIRLGAS